MNRLSTLSLIEKQQTLLRPQLGHPTGIFLEGQYGKRVARVKHLVSDEFFM